MKVGVSTASLFLRKNNEEALPLLSDLGVTTAEVFLTSFSEYEAEFAKLLLEKKGNLSVNSVHILNSQIEPQLFSAHERVKKDSFDVLEKVLTAANIIGAPYYTFHGTARYKKAARDPNNDNFERMGNGLKEIHGFCKDRGVTLCLENVEWSTYNRVGVFEKMQRYVPDLKGVLDIKQARISGYPYEFYLDEMGENIAYVHLSDINENGKMCLPGKGVFDFETLIKRLQDVGFDGALLIEAYKDDYCEISELKTSCDFLSEILYKNIK
ncbi:MAG: sugar phosphate isomerase/epimerase [Clostridia bacterium]|nr:sugar phosphate isomerase/epimerase [Clostridia bacterium]